MLGFSDQLVAEVITHSANLGFGLGDLQRIGNSIVKMMNQLSIIVRAVIIGISLLVGTIAGIYFLKKDRSGAEEGKGMLMRVAQAILVAVVAWMAFSAFAGWAAATFK
ncbi:hypothetical protein [Weissella minor]|uniref:hypothetical protein n=1 Tax=Weissella minor TaxID=1620 RepID=UPI003AF2F70C